MREVISLSKALILLNMGGINSPDEVEIFLKNMFMDKNIIPLNQILRRVIANRVINNRADEVRDNLNRYLNGKSPLLDITNSLAKKIEDKLNIKTIPIMRYTPPYAKDELKRLKDSGVDELILFSMYPQYSSTTTLSSIQDIKRSLKILNYNPKIRIIESYYDNKEYIELIINQILKSIDIKEQESLI